MREKILFVCLHNNASSQMAEAFLNQIYGRAFEGHSAGLQPGKLCVLAVEAMWEAGIDISASQTKWVYDYIKIGKKFTQIITLDEASAGRCPAFPGEQVRLNWNFAGLHEFQGTPQEKLVRTREVRDAIRREIEQWGANVCPSQPGNILEPN